MPDKKDFGYSFPCDGPGRGGTCDISAWDAFYLAVFWMLNTIGWVTFYWHWKHITLWQGNVSQFNESSTYLMGWLRDYLWLNSSQLINGYNPFGMNSLSVWAWMFLFGHLVWATGFMFLISWRGYWQELIDLLCIILHNLECYQFRYVDQIIQCKQKFLDSWRYRTAYKLSCSHIHHLSLQQLFQ